MRAGWLVFGVCVACGPSGADDRPSDVENGGATGAGGSSNAGGDSPGSSGGSGTPGGGGGGGTSIGSSGGAQAGSGGAGTGSTPVSSGGTLGAGGTFSPGGDTGAGGANPGAGGSTGPRVFDAGSDPNRNKVVAGNVCDRVATIQCAGEAYCCTDPRRDMATCKATLVAQCRNDLFLDTISLDALTGFSASHAETAFTAFEQRSANCDPGVAVWASTAAGLRGVVQGTKAGGASCTPGLTELNNDPKVAAHLASCSNPGANACLPSVGTWSCAARGGAGTDCFTDVNCSDGHYCPNPNLDIGGASCLARKPSGQPCAAPNECLSLTCRAGSCIDATAQTAFCLMP